MKALASALLLACWLVAGTPARAQADGPNPTHDFGGWLMVFGNGSFGRLHADLQRVRWWFDGQVRFLDDSNGYDQTLLRPGFGWAFSDEVTAWLGYAWIDTDPSGGSSSEEHRIWQQLLWAPRFGELGLQSRTRLEQRFIDTGSDTGVRIRQLVKATWPFRPGGRLGLAGYDEVFFDLNDTDTGQDAGFAQNRFWAGLFWKPDREGLVTIELGYLNQFIRNSGRANDRMNHIVSFHVLLSPR
ncbi:MAG: DUF2490 domain-containing protein [Myxococcota bacterium]|nr:DUF2490 domain-containing protein [Myxococcota bacterium]